MNDHEAASLDAGRRKFLRLWLATAASFLVASKTSAKAMEAVDSPSEYDGLLRKTEEFQESFLLSLPDAEMSALLSRIRTLRPGVTDILLSRGELGHVLRTWYVGLRLAKMRPPRSVPTKSAVTASNVLVPSQSPLRPPVPGNASYRTSFPRNMPGKIEPFDLFASENRAVMINGNFGVFDDGRCREHTWDGRPLETFLSLSHGDYVEISATESIIETSAWDYWKDFEMPPASVNAGTWIPLCSQVARKLGESFWFSFARWSSALASLGTYGRDHPRYSGFSSIPESKNVADVFMKSSVHPVFWHRAFAVRINGEWFVIDPFSHKRPIKADSYSRRGDVLAIIAFG